MSKVKLTDKQREALELYNEKSKFWPHHTSRKVLAKLGYIDCAIARKTMDGPAIAVEWIITPAGRKALEENK